MATLANSGSGLNNHRKFKVALGVFLLVVVIGAGALIYKNTHKSYNQEADLSNQAFMQGNKTQALDYAKKALAKEPNNVDAILLVANLTKAQDPSAAKQYYGQALDAFKQQNNPDAFGKPALTYWSAGELARQAGQTSQAIKYYQRFIQTASPSDSYQQSLVKQAQAELASLK
jgi:Tfp pilus assembly protein PilF